MSDEVYTLSDYHNGELADFQDGEWHYKGGKPNPGTPADRRLSENKPGGKKPSPPDDDEPPGKKPFPGAAKPFGKRG